MYLIIKAKITEGKKNETFDSFDTKKVQRVLIMYYDFFVY